MAAGYDLRLRTAVDFDASIRTLDETLTELANLAASTSINEYVVWADTAERRLRSVFSDGHIADNLFTSRYWHLFNWTGSPAGVDRGDVLVARPNHSLSSERQLQQTRMEALRAALKGLKAWALGGPGRLIVIDTNSLIHFAPPAAVDWAFVDDLPPALEGVPRVRLVVPLIVLDELDRKRYATDSSTVRRAKAAQRMLDDLFGDRPPGAPVPLQDDPGSATIEVFMDQPGHRRLDDPDDEIVDRASAIQGYVGANRPVLLLTHDVGMRMRAVAAGLRAIRYPAAYAKDQPSAGLATALSKEARRLQESSASLAELAEHAGRLESPAQE